MYFGVYTDPVRMWWIGRPVARIWKGGVHFRSQLSEGSVFVTHIFQLGGVVSPQRGPGQSPGAQPRRQTHFDNNLLKIGLKSGL